MNYLELSRGALSEKSIRQLYFDSKIDGVEAYMLLNKHVHSCARVCRNIIEDWRRERWSIVGSHLTKEDVHERNESEEVAKGVQGVEPNTY